MKINDLINKSSATGTATISKAATICIQLRQEIVSGKYAPGSRLETWDALECRFDVGRATLMRALNELRREEFIYASSTRGTFVTPHPPHLTRYALAFQGTPGVNSLLGWNRFWKALTHVASGMQSQDGRRVPMFFNINNHVDEMEHHRLMEDVLKDRLAGVIFVGPIEVMSSQILQNSRIPKVAISLTSPDAAYPGLYPDFDSFIARACDYLVERGHKRIAVLKSYGKEFAGFEAAIAARGMETRPYWQLPFNVIAPNAAFAATRLLLNSPAGERPDAMVICDDNLIESAMSAVIDAGIRPPSELEIVAHCNWQELWPAVVPCTRLGFDTSVVLHKAMEIIDIQRQGKQPPVWTGIPAQFEDELGGACREQSI